MAAGERLLGSIVQWRSAGHVEDSGDESRRRATMGDRERDQQRPCEIGYGTGRGDWVGRSRFSRPKSRSRGGFAPNAEACGEPQLLLKPCRMADCYGTLG